MMAWRVGGSTLREYTNCPPPADPTDSNFLGGNAGEDFFFKETRKV